ncbi:PIG-L family deacetylase [Streptomyces sp. NPDC046939]|uniref:PIG-L deacetylase family protein n=1 Tax=Streptomyces sp. NPDC046939 TaxID=3155376 RepID=UPI0034088DCF
MSATPHHDAVPAGPSRRSVLTAAGLTAAGVALHSTVGSTGAAAAAAPAIFYSPHQDDEAIGMAGTILEHKAAGRPVYLVLVTKGENGGIAQALDKNPCDLGDRCSAPGHYHKLGWQDTGDTPEVVSARTSEFMLSAKALGVDKVINFKLGDDAYGTPEEYTALVNKIRGKVRQLIEQYPGASHKFTAGWLDTTKPGEWPPNATHKACSDAAYFLKKNGELKDVRFNHIYTYEAYSRDKRDRGADYVVDIPASHMKKKQAAILAYNTWDPNRNLYTTGYHSVPVLMEQAYSDPREFVFELPSNYKAGRGY